jgi:Polyketide cyclase / dehydrase and lipid transport
MLLNILLAAAGIVVAIIVVFLIVVALQPADFRVSRTATMAASQSAVFEQVNDFHHWREWSPYDKRDPAMKKTYEGPPAGTGASYAWNGNNDVGEGRSTIIESRPHELIRIKLEFKRPFVGTSTAEFTFQAQGNQTAVTWSLIGQNNFVVKAIGLFMSMDKMIGGDFEQGLTNLKAVVEQG